MEYELLDHEAYESADHPPARKIAVGDTVILVFRSLEGYKVTEARKARVLEVDADHYVGELREPGMMIPVAAGEHVRFGLSQAFELPPFGDETLHVPTVKP